MTLDNFELASSIELKYGEEFWDLHNSADFRGFHFSPSDNTGAMIWDSSKSPSLPRHCGIKLFFVGLHFVHMTERDNDLPLSEDTCVADILRVDPNVQHPDPFMRQVQGSGDDFRLLFRFQSGRTIEIGCESVKLVPIEGSGA